MKLSNSILLFISISLCCIFVACDDSEDLSTEQAAKAVKITSCNIDCAVISDDSSRAGENYAWQEGDVLFIQLGPIHEGNDLSRFSWIGTATFLNNKWEIATADGWPTTIMPVANEQLCNIIFAPGIKVELNYARLNESNPIYSSATYNTTNEYGYFPDYNVNAQTFNTTNARYTLTEDGVLNITATLNPILTRIRIKGEKNQALALNGVYFPLDILCSFPEIFYSTKEFTCSVEENGQYYTPYFYVKPRKGPINIRVNDYVFGRQNLFANGKSYELILPTVDKPGNWMVEPYIEERFDLEAIIDGYTAGSTPAPIVLCSLISTQFEVHYDLHISSKSTSSTSPSSLYINIDFAERTSLDEYDEFTVGQVVNRQSSSWPIVISEPWAWKVYAFGSNATIEEGSYITMSNF